MSKKLFVVLTVLVLVAFCSNLGLAWKWPVDKWAHSWIPDSPQPPVEDNLQNVMRSPGWVHPWGDENILRGDPDADPWNENGSSFDEATLEDLTRKWPEDWAHTWWEND